MGRYKKTDSIGRYKGDGNIEGSNPRMRIITINVPERYCQLIENFIIWGKVPSRSEYIRQATAKAIEEDLKFTTVIDAIVEARDPTKIIVPNGDGTYQKYNILRRLE